MLVVPVLIDAPLRKVFGDRSIKPKIVFSQATAETSTVRQGVLIEIGAHKRTNGYRAAGYVPASRGEVRHHGADSLAKVFPERLIPEKEERLVPFYPATHTAAVLITLELGFLQAIEKISRIKIVVAMKEIQTPMIFVRARLTNDIHLPARVPPKLCTISTVSYTHLRAHETPEHLVCRLLLE